MNPLTRELVFKIVFYGPGLGGKTTTLQHIHATSKPEHRGNLVSLATDTDRTLYFDFLPLQVLKLRTMTVRLQLFTVPGQVYYAATRKLVLNGADGVVFVADSQSARGEANQESLDDLNANLAEHGRALSRLPHSFHWNKRDLPDVMPAEDLERRLNLFSAPATPTIATNGEGVFAGLEQITRAVFNAYRAELPKGKREPVPIFLDAEEVGLTDAIRDLADSQRSPPPASPQPERRPSGARALEAALTPARNPTSEPVTKKKKSAPAAALTPSQSMGDAAQTSPPPPSATITPSSSSFSLADLWPEGDRDGVRRAETLLGGRDAASAVLACDALLTRILAEASVALGPSDQARDPSLLALLLGLDGPSYLAFRTSVRAARQQKEVAAQDALDCYLTTVDARRGLARRSR